MKKSYATKSKRIHSLINLIGGLMLVVGAALGAVLFFINSPALQDWYQVYLDRVEEVEYYVLNNLPGIWLILLAVLLLYALKSVIYIPFSMLCVITGAALPEMFLSLSVNIVGLMILFSLRWLWGKKWGGGQVEKLLTLQRDVRRYIETERRSKFWLLFALRAVPVAPVNFVSRIYGSMGFDYADYMLISLLGFLPRLVSYTMVGEHIFKPLSVSFLVTMIIFFTLSGIATISINQVLSKRKESAP